MDPETSAQQAELTALTQVLKLAEGKSATVYCDSRYILGVVTDFGILWKQGGFVTTKGTPIKNGKLDQLAADIPPSTIPFKKASTGFKYLGIVITRSLRTLREQNRTLLTTKVKSDLQKWNYLPLSLAGRIQIIKMNVLPRYLYVFQCLPIFLPK